MEPRPRLSPPPSIHSAGYLATCTHTRCTLRCVPEEYIAGVIKQAMAEATGEEPHAVVTLAMDIECDESYYFMLRQPLWHDVSDARARDHRLAEDSSWKLGNMGSNSRHPCVLYHVVQPGLVPAYFDRYSAVHLVLPSVRYVEMSTFVCEM